MRAEIGIPEAVIIYYFESETILLARQLLNCSLGDKLLINFTWPYVCGTDFFSLALAKYCIPGTNVRGVY